MHRYANPTRFMKIADKILPWSLGATILAAGAGLYFGLYDSPPDYQQGDSVRIMYLHVPSAYMATMTYGLMAVASFVSLVWKHPLADVTAKAAAPIGMVFTGLALVTGSLWGKPTWGTWWQWDGRLTSVLILFFVYIGYMALWSALDDRAKAAKAAAILALVGAVNLPVIKFSVDWWSTLHQPASLMREGGPTMPGEMLLPLFIMLFAANTYMVTVLIWRMKAELAEFRLDALRRQLASEGEYD